MSDAAGATDPLLARALEVAADLKAKYDTCGQLPKGIDRFFQGIRALDERRKQQATLTKKKGGNGKGKPTQQQEDAPSSSSSSSTLALTPANLRALKRQRTAIEPDAAAATIPLHPPPTPEVVILRLIELPKLLVVRIVHMLEFHELASLDTTCAAFHPSAPVGLTQLSAEMRAQWVLKPWQMVKVPRPIWSRWLVDVWWRERMVSSGGRLACSCKGPDAQHMLVVSKEGVVMSCGYDAEDCEDGEENECPQLGHGAETKSQRTLKVIEALKTKKAEQVSAGGGHSLVLTKSGDVFSFGQGYFGQLGHGDLEWQDLPKLVEALKGKKVVQVSAGENHSLVLSENGDVFSFGFGTSGRLGHGDEKHQHLPKLVEALKGKKVVQVSAGENHSLVLTESGAVFSFGYGGAGQLGHGNTKGQYLPKLVEALKGKKVVQVSAGGLHSLVLTENGDVFSFGKGMWGQLGHGDRENQYLPKLVEALKGKKVVQVSAGGLHSLVLAESGDVFSFGDEDNGKLGHGDEKVQPLPMLVEALKDKKAVNVEAGREQSLVLTKDGRILFSGLRSRRQNPEWDNELAFDEDGEENEDYDVPWHIDVVQELAFGHELALPKLKDGEREREFLISRDR